MGSDVDSLSALRRDIASGRVVGPRIVFAGPLLQGAAPWGTPPSYVWVVPSATAATGVVDSLRNRGVTFVKVHDYLRPDVLWALMAEARRAGLKVVGHLRPGVTVRQLIDSGKTSIEHMPHELVAACADQGEARVNGLYSAWQKSGFRDDTLLARRQQLHADVIPAKCRALHETMAARDVRLLPTLTLNTALLAAAGMRSADSLGVFTPDRRRRCEDRIVALGAVPRSLRETHWRAQLADVRDVRRAGVTIIAGTDFPQDCVPAGTSLLTELELLVDAGLSPFEALAAATRDAARLSLAADSVGTIGVGKAADLVLLDRNPLLDIRHMRSIDGVVQRGVWFPAARLAALRAAAVQRVPARWRSRRSSSSAAARDR